MPSISGRGSRGEFCKFIAFYLPVNLVLLVARKVMLENGMAEESLLCLLFIFILIGFFITFCARRLHDMGNSGLWSLLFFVPFGILVLLIWCGGKRGQIEANQWGENPLNLRKE